MTRNDRLLHVVLLGAFALGLRTPAWAAPEEVTLDEARIFFEFNTEGDGDLGTHVFLDGEAWKSLKIVSPDKRTILDVEGKASFATTGLTELFIEGEEPSLLEVPVAEFLDRFPDGDYQISGSTAEGAKLVGTATLSHAVPAGPVVAAAVLPGNVVTISWQLVTGPAVGFPNLPIDIVGYQVIVGSFQVTLPDMATSVTLPQAFADSLDPGTHEFEVLAIDIGGNQTITQGSFVTQ